MILKLNKKLLILFQLESYTSAGPPTFFHNDNEKDEIFEQAVVQSDKNVCKVSLSHLDWLNYNLEKYKKSDVVLGSDIVYERTLIEPLCKVLR